MSIMFKNICYGVLSNISSFASFLVVAVVRSIRLDGCNFFALNRSGIFRLSSDKTASPYLCLNYLKKISQTWWSNVGSILQ
jgi:hypothetical protein